MVRDVGGAGSGLLLRYWLPVSTAKLTYRRLTTRSLDLASRTARVGSTEQFTYDVGAVADRGPRGSRTLRLGAEAVQDTACSVTWYDDGRLRTVNASTIDRRGDVVSAVAEIVGTAITSFLPGSGGANLREGDESGPWEDANFGRWRAEHAGVSDRLTRLLAVHAELVQALVEFESPAAVNGRYEILAARRDDVERQIGGIVQSIAGYDASLDPAVELTVDFDGLEEQHLLRELGTSETMRELPHSLSADDETHAAGDGRSSPVRVRVVVEHSTGDEVDPSRESKEDDVVIRVPRLARLGVYTRDPYTPDPYTPDPYTPGHDGARAATGQSPPGEWTLRSTRDVLFVNRRSDRTAVPVRSRGAGNSELSVEFGPDGVPASLSYGRGSALASWLGAANSAVGGTGIFKVLAGR